MFTIHELLHFMTNILWIVKNHGPTYKMNLIFYFMKLLNMVQVKQSSYTPWRRFGEEV
jgi:hypothetical protein